MQLTADRATAEQSIADRWVLADVIDISEEPHPNHMIVLLRRGDDRDRLEWTFPVLSRSEYHRASNNLLSHKGEEIIAMIASNPNYLRIDFEKGGYWQVSLILPSPRRPCNAPVQYFALKPNQGQ